MAPGPELTLPCSSTAEDPKAYTKMWESDTKIYTFLRNGEGGNGGTLLHTEEEEAFTEENQGTRAGRPSN